MALIPKYSQEKFESCLNTFREIFSEPAVDGFKGSVLLPLDFSLEMDGISGIIPNSAFEIPTNCLPKTYLTKKGESRIAFILHSIDQNFNDNKWTTKITGQTLVIRYDELTEEQKVKVKTIQDNLKKKAQKVASTPPSSGKPAKNKQAAYDRAETNYPGFKAKLKQVAAAIGVSEMDLVTVMYKESAGTLDPTIKNSIGCVGLIQFCPDKKRGATKRIGTTTYNLSTIQNSGVDQLNYVEKYFKALGFNSSTPRTAGQLYGATFYPVSRNKPKDWVFGSEDKSSEWKFKVARDNPAITAFSTKTIDGKKVIDGYAFEKYVNS